MMIVARWAAASAAALVLAACGGGGSGNGEPTPPPTPPVVTPTSSVSLLATAQADPVAGGEAAQLTVTLRNGGAVAAMGVVLSPHFAKGIKFTSYSCSGTGGGTCPDTLVTAADSWALPDLPAQASLTLVFKVNVAVGSSGPLTSMPVVLVGNDAVTTDNTAPAVILAYTADLSVSGSGPAAPVPAGSAMAYRMTVSNTGPDEARDVKVTNLLSPFQSPGALSCSASGGATCPAVLGGEMRVPRLPKSGSLVFTVPATVQQGMNVGIANLMMVVSAGDPVDNNNAVAVQQSAYVPGPAAVPGQSVISLQSDVGDFIGGGRSYIYTRTNANLQLWDDGVRLRFFISGDEEWQAELWQRDGSAQFKPGHYTGLPRGTFEWTGESRACNRSTTDLTIDSVSYAAGQLSVIAFSFEQHCEDGSPALRGQVRWHANDTTAPPGPLDPPPRLWSPAAGTTPATGNYVYLQSEPGDFVGNGQSFMYTQTDAVLTVTAPGGLANVKVAGDTNWEGNFQAMLSLPRLQPGYYGILKRYPFYNPARGGLAWGGSGRGCNQLNGWFVVDRVSYVDNALSTLDLRFEQQCDDAWEVLRGQVHWDASDRTAPPGPVNPPPAGLWAPAADATPASGSYIYLVSDADDFIGGGKTYTHTRSDSVLAANVDGRLLSVSVNGGWSWSGKFLGMNSIAELKPGYYGDLRRYPFNNPAKGGLNWDGNSKGCTQLLGWFVVDRITIASGKVTGLDLRFEQHCEGAVAALRGKIHLEP